MKKQNGYRGWCNYCKLKRLECEAEEKGLVVTIQLSIDDCGHDVFLHPLDVEIPKHIRRRDEPDLPEVEYWQTWLFDRYEERGCYCD